MLSHDERVTVARSAVDYLTGPTRTEMTRPVPNCPGWTVYNAAVHVARSCVSWEHMMGCAPDDATARDRAAAARETLPSGVEPAELHGWCRSLLDVVAGQETRPCFFPLTGGAGTIGLWGWHAASELGVHRLDVEAALGHDHAITDLEAADAVSYVCDIVSPAMRRAAGEDPGTVDIELVSATGEPIDQATVESDTARRVAVRGPAVQVLLALWGRPHRAVNVTAGDAQVWTRWQQLPATAFQFGTWN